MSENIPKFLYCFHGDKYARESVDSWRSLRRSNESNEVHCVCPIEYLPKDTSMIHHNLPIEARGRIGYGYKLEAISSAPISRFIFLDTDTTIVGSLDQLWERSASAGIIGVIDPLLDTFLHIPSLKRPASWGGSNDCLQELNSGVLAINRDLLPSAFFATWSRFHSELIRENPGIPPASIPDQPSLIQAIRELGVIPLILGSEFNFRPCYPQVLYTAARIVHIHKQAYTSHLSGAGVFGDVSVVFPWGLSMRRGGFVNRALYAIRRTVGRIVK